MADEKLPAELNQPALTGLTSIRKEMTETMKEIATIAEKGASTLLLSLGGGLLLFTFLFKVDAFGFHIANLTTAEFISAILVSMVLLLAGAGMRLLQLRWQEQASKSVRDAGVELLSKGFDTKDRERGYI